MSTEEQQKHEAAIETWRQVAMAVVAQAHHVGDSGAFILYDDEINEICDLARRAPRPEPTLPEPEIEARMVDQIADSAIAHRAFPHQSIQGILALTEQDEIEDCHLGGDYTQLGNVTKVIMRGLRLTIDGDTLTVTSLAAEPAPDPRPVDLDTARRNYKFRLDATDTDRCRDCRHVQFSHDNHAECSLLDIHVFNTRKSRCERHEPKPEPVAKDLPIDEGDANRLMALIDAAMASRSLFANIAMNHRGTPCRLIAAFGDGIQLADEWVGGLLRGPDGKATEIPRGLHDLAEHNEQMHRKAVFEFLDDMQAGKGDSVSSLDQAVHVLCLWALEQRESKGRTRPSSALLDVAKYVLGSYRLQAPKDLDAGMDDLCHAIAAEEARGPSNGDAYECGRRNALFKIRDFVVDLPVVPKAVARFINEQLALGSNEVEPKKVTCTGEYHCENICETQSALVAEVEQLRKERDGSRAAGDAKLRELRAWAEDDWDLHASKDLKNNSEQVRSAIDGRMGAMRGTVKQIDRLLANPPANPPSADDPDWHQIMTQWLEHRDAGRPCSPETLAAVLATIVRRELARGAK